MNRVLIAPAPMKEIEPVFGPTLRAAGLELVYPKRNAQMSEAEILQNLPGCIALMAGSEPNTAKVIATAAAAGLKVIGRAGVGYDGIHLPTATAHGIPVTISVGANHNAVAEHAFMMMLAMLRKLVKQHHETKAGLWPRKANFPLRGKTLGVAGVGRIGKRMVQIAQAFEMKVIGYDPFPNEAFFKEHNLPLVSLEQLFQDSDILTLHMPLTPESHNFARKETLAMMKPTAYLINTARGEVVDADALAEALHAKRLAGAAIDVFVEEPAPATHPLFACESCLVSAHTAGVDTASRDDMALFAAQGIVKLLAGEWPEEWVINPEVRPAYEAGLRGGKVPRD